MSIIILAKLTAAKGQLETVLQHQIPQSYATQGSSRTDIKDLADHAAKHEPGTLIYMPTQDPNDPFKITVWEEYESTEAHQAHNAVAPVVAFKAVKDSILAGGLHVERLKKL